MHELLINAKVTTKAFALTATDITQIAFGTAKTASTQIATAVTASNEKIVTSLEAIAVSNQAVAAKLAVIGEQSWFVPKVTLDGLLGLLGLVAAYLLGEWNAKRKEKLQRRKEYSTAKNVISALRLELGRARGALINKVTLMPLAEIHRHRLVSLYYIPDTLMQAVDRAYDTYEKARTGSVPSEIAVDTINSALNESKSFKHLILSSLLDEFPDYFAVREALGVRDVDDLIP